MYDIGSNVPNCHYIQAKINVYSVHILNYNSSTYQHALYIPKSEYVYPCESESVHMRVWSLWRCVTVGVV